VRLPTAGIVLAPDPRFHVIDAMNGTTSELAVVDLLEMLGYDDVERIGGFDKGADIVATDEGERIAVQVKRRSSAAGISAARQLIDGKKRYGCSRGLVITNNFFTEQAIECAQSWEIELWDRKVLSDFVEGEAPVVNRSVCAEYVDP
jgi:HJR/Mrr/RecB family endonuclease